MRPALERLTFQTMAGARATNTKNTPTGTGPASRCSWAIRCFRSPALQVITGTSLALAQPRTRRAKRPAIRIKWVSSRSSSLPCQRRHQVRNPPGPQPTEKYALSTIRSTQS